MSSPTNQQLQYLWVSGWSNLHGYQDRFPVWLKIQTALLNEYRFVQLPEPTRLHLLLIWLLAGSDNGRIPHNVEFITRRISADSPVDIDALIDAGFLLTDEPEGWVAYDQAEANTMRSGKATASRIKNPRTHSPTHLSTHLREQVAEQVREQKERKTERKAAREHGQTAAPIGPENPRAGAEQFGSGGGPPPEWHLLKEEMRGFAKPGNGQ